MSDQQIAEGLRDLVRRGILAGHYRFADSRGVWWTIVTTAGPTATHNRESIIEYLELAQEVPA